MNEEIELPFGWSACTVRDVAESMKNGIYKAKEYYHADGTPCLRMYNIESGRLVWEDLKRMELTDSEIEEYGLLPGDVVVNRVNSRELVGKACVIPMGLGSAVFESKNIRLRVDGRLVNSHYVNYRLLQMGRRHFAYNAQQTVGMASINQDQLGAFPFPLAPRREQDRIVAKLDELFSDLDAGVAALERAKANLKRYRAAVLKAAVEGRLTESWRATHAPRETGEQLLKRVLNERRRKWEETQLAAFAAAGKPPPKNWRLRYKEPAAPDTTDLPPLPAGWCWANLGQLLHGIEGGKSFKCLTRPAGPDEWGVVKVSAMTWGTFLEDEQKATPSGASFDPHDEIRRGDILLSRSNTTELVGATVLVGDCRPRLLMSDKSLRLLVSDGLNRRWLHTALSSPVVRRQLSAMATGTSDSMRNVSQEKIESVVIQVPPAMEQAVIADEVLSRISIADKSGCELVAALRRSARLRQSILKTAFSGKLVAQDPADEPASVLLARIEQSRAAMVRTKGKPPNDEFLRRAAIVSYIVKRLAAQPSFGRTQLEKTLHLAQSHLGIDLGLKFERYAAGPFDKSIYRLEGAARKSGWFTKKERPRFGVTYHPGPKIDDLCQHAARLLGEKQADFDRLLDQIATMNTDEAELFATAYAAWNDLLIDGRPADDNSIIAEIYGWHESKKKFPRAVILKRLQWMRGNEYVPTGHGKRTKPMKGNSAKIVRRPASR